MSQPAMATSIPTRRFDPSTMLQLVSRTFALSIEQLPGLMRDSITVAYLMFRVSDFLEDNEIMPSEQKVKLLNLWIDVMRGDEEAEHLARQLTNVDPTDPEALVAQQAGEVLALLQRLPEELQGFILQECIESAAGMARWQARGPVVLTEADMDDYMFEVAGRVGHMLTRIFTWYHKPMAELAEELMPLAREFGLALQTVNVIRGLRKDYERGWIFVPESFCARVGIKPPDLFQPENLEPAMQVIDMLTEKAEGHLQKGLTFIKKIPRRYHRLRLACMWPLFFAVRTLAISRGNDNVLLNEAKMSRDEVKQIVMSTQALGWSNTFLDAYYERLNS